MKSTNDLKLIGRGSFTRAYLNSNNEVILYSACPIKECMSMGWFPESDFFPVIERIENEVYKMEYYPRVSSLKNNLIPEHYEIYKTLRALNIGYVKNSYDYHNEWHKQFDTLDNQELATALHEALDACGNYGSDIGFEISPRNVAVKNGKLILLDCFYSISKLEESRK